MTTESLVKMVESAGTRKWPTLNDIATFGPHIKSKEEEEFEVLLNGWKAQTDMIPNRSGSAPPSMEGSLAAIGNILAGQNLGISSTLESLGREIGNFESEEELRSDPAYFVYYCSNVNLNPRLPLPLMSSENRRLVRHMGGFGNHWKSASSNEVKNISFQLSKGSLPTHKEEPEDDVSFKDTLESSATASGQNTSFSGRYKSLVDLIQEDFPRTASPVYSQSCSSSLVPDEAIVLDINAILSNASSLKISNVAERNSGIPEVSNKLHILEAHARERSSAYKVGSNSSTIGLEGGASIGGSSVARVESQYHPSTQRRTPGVQAQSVSQDVKNIHNNIGYLSHNHVKPSHAEVQPSLHAPMHNSTFYAAGGCTAGGPPFYPNLQPTGLYYPHYGVGAFAFGSGFVPQFVEGYPSHTSINGPFGACSSSAGETMQHADGFQHLGKIYGQQGFMVQPSIDPQNMQYFHQPFGDAYKAASLHNLFTINAASSQIDSFVAPKSPSTNVSDTKFQQATNGNFVTPNIGGEGFAGNSFYIGSSGMGVMPQFPASPLSSPVLPSSLVGGINHLSSPNSMSFPQGLIRNAGSFLGGQGHKGLRVFDDTKRHSFLEELRSSNAGKVELEDIAGHIVELSMDQHGSRFIQQKLDYCSVEETLSVFKEVLPHSSKLMTDVFGNYVIQKFFEHGSPEQRKELADELSGQMLHLSLQMYGCRVIQKALEVIELDQKTRLAQELDGHVIKCVHDQNGNHVIQKCIECVPAENIQFIISAFQGQVATLSTHPYGCRVIQRVLEHCLDDAQSGSIVDEILESADVLARDQYGNYVTQHVLERGKHDERRQIISKLSGKIVQMSQHKYASNVIEKCLQYGDPADRDLLIQEIVGQSQGNNNLLTMMKDQFANYVVQKILEICNDEQKKTLLNSIRSHLHALRKYTYGKHIVARFEKLCDIESQALES